MLNQYKGPSDKAYENDFVSQFKPLADGTWEDFGSVAWIEGGDGEIMAALGGTTLAIIFAFFRILPANGTGTSCNCGFEQIFKIGFLVGIT